MTDDTNEYGIETHHRQGGDPSHAQLNKAEDDGKQPTELQKALTRKFENEADFIKGDQTSKTQQETALLRSRQVESGATVAKLRADTAFRRGAETKRTRAEAKLAAQRAGESRASRRKLTADARFREGAETKRAQAETQLARRKAGESGASRTKLRADARFRNGPETVLAAAEAILASARAAESRAVEAVRRAEKIERDANVHRIAAEEVERRANAQFTSGPRTRSEVARARESRSVAIKNYASLLDPLLKCGIFLGILFFFVRFVFFPELF